MRNAALKDVRWWWGGNVKSVNGKLGGRAGWGCGGGDSSVWGF